MPRTNAIQLANSLVPNLQPCRDTSCLREFENRETTLSRKRNEPRSSNQANVRPCLLRCMRHERQLSLVPMRARVCCKFSGERLPTDTPNQEALCEAPPLVLLLACHFASLMSLPEASSLHITYIDAYLASFTHPPKGQ